MSDGYEKTLRPTMVYQTGIIWTMSTDKIATVIQAIKKVLSQDAQEKVELSYNTFEDIIVGLKTSEDYQREENPICFKNSMEELKDVFKHVFEAYMLARSISVSGDNIDDLREEFYKDIAKRRGTANFVAQAYPPITYLVRLIRNRQHATLGPVDHITGKRSFGNVYTLCSAIILSIYAYTEILEAWEETERSHRP